MLSFTENFFTQQNGSHYHLVSLCVLQCPDSASKRDLIAYLERIALYCHQLNITSKVKADVQNISGELIVSGVCHHHKPCANVFTLHHPMYHQNVSLIKILTVYYQFMR